MFLIVPQLRPKRRGVSGAGWGPRRWRRTVLHLGAGRRRSRPGTESVAGRL